MAAGAGTVYAADFTEAQTQYEVAVQSARQSHINLAKQVKAVQKTDKIPAGQLLGKDHDLVSRMDSAMLGAKGQLKENIAHNPDAGRMSISQIRELTETIKKPRLSQYFFLFHAEPTRLLFDTPVVETTGFLRTGLACTRALGRVQRLPIFSGLSPIVGRFFFRYWFS